MRTEIEVTIDEKTGEVTFHAQGFQGKNCLAELQKLVDAVGESDGKGPKYTPEYHKAATVVKGGR